MPQSRSLWKRSLRLMGMSTQIAAQEISKRLLNKPELESRIKQAKALTETLSELKGAAMKAGQLLSLEASEFVPPEIAEILSQLQSEAKPLPFDQVQEVLASELGDEKRRRIKELSHTPAGSASIGQVHKAEIDGHAVAIKIQYPGVADAIDSDLKILRKAAESFLKISGKKFSLESTFAELKAVLKNETDYLHELQSLNAYHEKLLSYQGYRAPTGYDEFSTQKILTMSWEPGVPIREWIKASPAVEQKSMIAKKILNLFCMEFVDWGLVQTDPNFGNFKVDDSNQDLVCLDFGATLQYSTEFRKNYAMLLRTFSGQNTDRIFQAAVEGGLLDPRESREVQIAFKDLMTVSLEPFNEHKQPFVFADRDFEKRTRDANLRFASLLKYSPPPRQLLFLHRKLGGIFNLVKLMDVRIDLRPYWGRMTSEQNQPN